MRFFHHINHVASGGVAPVDKTVTYGTVTNIPGETSKCWITSNLGADHQATAVNDATEASAGWYWQFNRMQGYKHDGTTRTPNTTWITSINENLDWQAANDPCALELGNGWRIPTYTEWTNVDASWRLDKLERPVELCFKAPCCRFPLPHRWFTDTPAAQAEVPGVVRSQAMMSACIWISSVVIAS